ncbi:hypothetical protein VNO77_46922 [Canavalia gladiata]|uniref:Uncharacterized protein n=1 Tax=Canavalia gladiata TaxID=3824 RepID=A0AAN9PHB7_CANGL
MQKELQYFHSGILVPWAWGSSPSPTSSLSSSLSRRLSWSPRIHLFLSTSLESSLLFHSDSQASKEGYHPTVLLVLLKQPVFLPEPGKAECPSTWGSASKGPFCVINWAIEEISFKVELLVYPPVVLSVGKDSPVLGYGNKPPRLKHWISFTGDSEYPRGLVKRIVRTGKIEKLW